MARKRLDRKGTGLRSPGRRLPEEERLSLLRLPIATTGPHPAGACIGLHGMVHVTEMGVIEVQIVTRSVLPRRVQMGGAGQRADEQEDGAYRPCHDSTHGSSISSRRRFRFHSPKKPVRDR